MTASVTLAAMADLTNDVNKTGAPIGGVVGGVVRDRWDQTATVACSDMAGALFVSKCQGNVWRLADAKPGGARGSGAGGGAGENPSHFVIPVTP
jgi:hypothetical protein